MSKFFHFINEHLLLSITVVIILSVVFVFISCKDKKAVVANKNAEPTKVNHAEWTKDANIYEVNLRQFTKEGTFKAFEAHLPRLKEMGVDILWFMPIHPVGVKNRKGTLGSYYSVKDYYTVDPAYGTMEEFKMMVEKAHQLGMKVIIDWVANHSAWDNPWVELHPEWYTKDSNGKMVSPFDWTDVVDLDFNNQELRKEMIKALSFWLTKTGIDGFRCDVAMMVPADFWNAARAELQKIKPDIFMLAEAEDAALQIEAFNMYYGWELHHIMNQIAKGKKNAHAIDSYLVKADSTFPSGTYRMNFITNHDENSWNGTEFERMGNAVNVMAVFAHTLPDMPLIYSGQEAGLNKRLEFFEKDSISWQNLELASFYKKLLVLKKENKALWNGKFGAGIEKIKTGQDSALYCFARSIENNTVIVLLNFSAKDRSFIPSSHHGDYIDYFSGKEVILNKKQKITLKAWGYQILVANN